MIFVVACSLKRLLYLDLAVKVFPFLFLVVNDFSRRRAGGQASRELHSASR
jgi:hypothetical protein